MKLTVSAIEQVKLAAEAHLARAQARDQGEYNDGVLVLTVPKKSGGGEQLAVH